MNTTELNSILMFVIPLIVVILTIVKLYLREKMYHLEIEVFGYPRGLAIKNGCDWKAPDEMRKLFRLNEIEQDNLECQLRIESHMEEVRYRLTRLKL